MIAYPTSSLLFLVYRTLFAYWASQVAFKKRKKVHSFISRFYYTLFQENAWWKRRKKRIIIHNILYKHHEQETYNMIIYNIIKTCETKEHWLDYIWDLYEIHKTRRKWKKSIYHERNVIQAAYFVSLRFNTALPLNAWRIEILQKKKVLKTIGEILALFFFYVILSI